MNRFVQILSFSGNEDICYYNNLCAHPLTVTSQFTVSAFNNLFSNIGYVILGLLCILKAPWRYSLKYLNLNLPSELLHRHYLQFKDHDTQHSQNKGVPLTFGFFVAIGN